MYPMKSEKKVEQFHSNNMEEVNLIMARKENPIKIKEVIFTYTGTDNAFNIFLKAIINEYLTKNILPEKD